MFKLNNYCLVLALGCSFGLSGMNNYGRSQDAPNNKKKPVESAADAYTHAMREAGVELKDGKMKFINQADPELMKSENKLAKL